MEESNKTFLLAKNLADVFYHIKTVSDLCIVGSCTHMRNLRCKAVSTRNIPELQNIDKKERYIDFGPAVTLSQIAMMGKSNMPSVLYDAVESTATGPIRNIATLGGNICREGQKGTLFAPLLALDARLEIKNPSSTKYIPFIKFTQIPKSFVLTKIRVPVSDWEVSVFKRLGPERGPSPLNASFVFLVDTENDLIVNLKTAFTGEMVFRSRELENKLIGSKLPLSDRAIGDFLVSAESLSREAFHKSMAYPILKDQFLNLLEYNLKLLS
ncbi:MAG: FAD binding domain-containing protein [Treponema sp.]|nr:FAD binding domain-containing protein [Treponema sp.]